MPLSLDELILQVLLEMAEEEKPGEQSVRIIEKRIFSADGKEDEDE